MGTLKDKKILVTGAGTGIGRAIALEFARHGAQLGIHYFSSKDLAAQVKQEITAQAVKAQTFQADLTQPHQARNMVEEFARWAGGIDVLVNNAGDIVGRKKLDEMDPQFLRNVIAVNVDSAVMTTQAALPYLKTAAAQGGAAIVNMSSLAGRLATGNGAGAYCAAKGAIITWTRNLARELGPQGIRVNAVAPGLILDTKFHATHTPQQSIADTIDAIPIGRAGLPADVARAIVYLAAEYDGFITGAILDINGGVY